MNKKYILIILAVLVLFLVLFFFGRKDLEVEENFNLNNSREIAQDWIVNNSATYLFDGSNLNFVSEEEIIEGKLYLFAFSFDSRVAGYGDRSDEMSAQVITPHLIEILVDEGRVINAVTDQIYDEIKGEMIGETMSKMIDLSIYLLQGEDFVVVERSVPDTLEIERAAIEELLKGPLFGEIEDGISTAINQGTELQDINIQDGVVFVDFDQRLNEGVAGSAMVMAIRGQIEQTLTQFETIDQVIISIDGETETILQP